MLKLLSLLALTLAITCIPYYDQRTLAASLIVGREDESDLYDWQCKVCNQQNKPIHAHFIQEKAVDVKAVITVYSDFIVLAFRYTNTAQNVWQDILYPLQIKDKNTCSKCKVQKAYHNMWETIKSDVYDDLIEIKKQTGLETLYITGISMGGGLTVLSYIDIAFDKLFDRIKVITFGAPRVGNKHWAAHFDQITAGATKRYLIRGDPIVVMPRCLTLLCTYRQTGIQIVCNENTEICKQEQYIPDDDYRILSDFLYHKDRIDSSLREMTLKGGIISHINGYPKLYDYTLELDF